MSKITQETYLCDLCGKKLPTHKNELNIVTPISKINPWSRLHVIIDHEHGFHNNATTEPACTCKECAIKLLTDALERINKNERASKGTESSSQENWNN